MILAQNRFFHKMTALWQLYRPNKMSEVNPRAHGNLQTVIRNSYLFAELKDQRGQRVHGGVPQLWSDVQSAHDRVNNSGGIICEVQRLGQAV